MSSACDCIVLGVGGFGSGALDHLARRGANVLGIERFDVAHERGSSHGETRIIRRAYFEHPDYVPLLLRAYEQWSELEADAGRPLVNLCGLMLAGPPDGEAISGARLSAERYAVPIENLSRDEAAARFRGFRFPQGCAVVYEPHAGYLLVEECVRAHVERAAAHGASLRTGETVVDWSSTGRTVRVRTDRGEYEAAKLVVTAGPWASQMLAELSLPLSVVRKAVFWHAVKTADYDVHSGCPASYFELPGAKGGREPFSANGAESAETVAGKRLPTPSPARAFYGFPCLDRQTVKLAEHTGGDPVADPLALDRGMHAADAQPVGRFVEQVLPGVDRVPVRHSVCMYTHTPDGHFIIDRHPRRENVILAAGFSGHGFKFTTVLGEALADLALEGRTKLPIGFLSLDRQTLQA